MLYGVGCSVGAGIYCLVGIGAQLAGPAISLSFGICGTACIFTSLAYAEFAARIPLTGSAYVYAYVAFGEYWGWLVGWFLTLGIWLYRVGRGAIVGGLCRQLFARSHGMVSHVSNAVSDIWRIYVFAIVHCHCGIVHMGTSVGCQGEFTI